MSRHMNSPCHIVNGGAMSLDPWCKVHQRSASWCIRDLREENERLRASCEHGVPCSEKCVTCARAALSTTGRKGATRNQRPPATPKPPPESASAREAELERELATEREHTKALEENERHWMKQADARDAAEARVKELEELAGRDCDNPMPDAPCVCCQERLRDLADLSPSPMTGKVE